MYMCMQAHWWMGEDFVYCIAVSSCCMRQIKLAFHEKSVAEILGEISMRPIKITNHPGLLHMTARSILLLSKHILFFYFRPTTIYYPNHQTYYSTRSVYTLLRATVMYGRVLSVPPVFALQVYSSLKRIGFIASKVYLSEWVCGQNSHWLYYYLFHTHPLVSPGLTTTRELSDKQPYTWLMHSIKLKDANWLFCFA